MQNAAIFKNLKIVITAGFIAGSLDMLSAFVDYYIQTRKGPAGVLKFIASGAFGNADLAMVIQ